ncbi:unnamed protein product [Ectocarpus sp. 8 AP-2014]
MYMLANDMSRDRPALTFSISFLMYKVISSSSQLPLNTYTTSVFSFVFSKISFNLSALADGGSEEKRNVLIVYRCWPTPCEYYPSF